MGKAGIFLVILVVATSGCAQRVDREIEQSAGAGETTGFVSINGVELPYFIEGDGIPCVVTLHATFLAGTLSPELRKHFQFIFADSRHMTTIDPELDVSYVTMNTLVDDIEAVRKALGHDRIAVLGHSTAGLLALAYARKYPQQTSHVIMIGTPLSWNREAGEAFVDYWEAHASEERKAILERNNEKLTEEALRKVPFGKRFIVSYIAGTPQYWYDPNYDPTPLFEGIEWNTNFVSQWLGPIMDSQNAADYLTEIETPAFLALGEHDFAGFYIHQWEAHKDKLSNLTYIVFENSAHYPMMEEQELFDRKLIEWAEAQQE
jgi:proline iminopeptidase